MPPRRTATDGGGPPVRRRRPDRHGVRADVEPGRHPVARGDRRRHGCLGSGHRLGIPPAPRRARARWKPCVRRGGDRPGRAPPRPVAAGRDAGRAERGDRHADRAGHAAVRRREHGSGYPGRTGRARVRAFCRWTGYVRSEDSRPRGWAWHSCAGSCRPTAGPSGCSPTPARARSSRCGCPRPGAPLRVGPERDLGASPDAAPAGWTDDPVRFDRLIGGEGDR